MCDFGPTVMFTGHRIIPRERLPGLTAELDRVISEYPRSLFICGGAIGFDTLAANAVLRAKLIMPEIALVLVLPCTNQSELWPPDARADYDIILSCADHIAIATRGPYTPGCMQKRNKLMVDACDVCVAYYTGRRGGTAETLGYALKKGKRTVILDNRGKTEQTGLF